ncbi:B3 domain-containing protein_Os12g40080-like [Miscanthus floridulus]|uniref:B3 domain-containing protein_Os12g40080-like n=1 Tax=Miscanthus floridulus TaxID=154761 RepID=UPI0034588612
MGSSCENRMRWWDHQDRNCVSNEKMRFHVVADEGFRSYLRVPQEFGSHLRKIISDTIKLNAPNGCVYDIEICREMGEIVLRSGWDVFATAHNLEQNNYLVFKFCWNSSFKVQIYNSCGGSQKITSCVNPHPEILEAVPNSTTSVSHISNGGEMSYAGHVQTLAGSDYFTSGGSRLTKAQDKKVLELADTIKSKIPLYVAVMNKSNVDLNCCFIRIPSILMKDVTEKVLKATVKLEVPDANVYGVSAAQQGSDEIALQFGWDAFVVAHHVQEHDLWANNLTIFRHKGNSRLEVFILDPNGRQKISSWYVTRDVCNTQQRCDDSVEIDPPHETGDIIDLSSCSEDDNIVTSYTTESAMCKKQHLNHCAKTRRMASSSCPSTKLGHDLWVSMAGRVDLSPLNSNNSEGPSRPPYIISSKVSLSRVQEKMVLGKVQAIGSEFLIHVSVMNKCSIGEKAFFMCFAMDYARRYLPSTTQDLILQLEGCQSKQWHTVLHVQGGHSRARDKCRIASGWAEFVSDNHLWLGDICLFELVETTRRLRMNMHLIRKSRYRSAYIKL